ncbi:MAG: hypothetical protein WD715_16990 [Dongiaceae bacterium]
MALRKYLGEYVRRTARFQDRQDVMGLLWGAFVPVMLLAMGLQFDFSETVENLLKYVAAAWVFFYLGLVVPYQIWRDKYEELESYTGAAPNMTFKEFFDRQFGYADLSDEETGNEIMRWCVDIRQKAILDLIHVWGRRDPDNWSIESVPITPIPKSHWVGNQIDYLEIVKDVLGATEVTDLAYAELPFKDLRFSKQEIEREWPAKRKEKQWQLANIFHSKKPANKGC